MNEESEIADFMWDLVEEDGHGGGGAEGGGGVERRRKGEAVGDVVGEIGDEVEEAGEFD